MEPHKRITFEAEIGLDEYEIQKPSRGVSAYMDLMGKIERQLEAWDAEMEAVHVAPTDKVRTLLRYACDELRDRDRQVTTRALRKSTR